MGELLANNTHKLMSIREGCNAPFNLVKLLLNLPFR